MRNGWPPWPPTTIFLTEKPTMISAVARREAAPEPNHAVEALVLNCMDYRLIGAVYNYLASRGLAGKYDQITLAGGAIGVMSDQTTEWANTFWQHVTLAKDLHDVRKVIVIDHRDCGACKAFVGKDCADERDGERQIHEECMGSLAKEIKIREPDLDVELLLMDLDGSVEDLSRTSRATGQ